MKLYTKAMLLGFALTSGLLLPVSLNEIRNLLDTELKTEVVEAERAPLIKSLKRRLQEAFSTFKMGNFTDPVAIDTKRLDDDGNSCMQLFTDKPEHFARAVRFLMMVKNDDPRVRSWMQLPAESGDYMHKVYAQRRRFMTAIANLLVANGVNYRKPTRPRRAAPTREDALKEVGESSFSPTSHRLAYPHEAS